MSADALGVIDDTQVELRRRFLATLERTQYLSEADMARYQASLLEALLRHAAREVPFYRDGRLAPVLRDGGGLDMERWHEVPVLTRQQARAAGTALHAERVPEAAGRAGENSTSGSTGSPFVFPRSAISTLASQCSYERQLAWFGVARQDSVALIHAVDGDDDRHTPRTPRLVHQLNTSQTSVDPLAWLAATSAEHLATSPTFARDLARQIRDKSAPPVRLKTVQTFGEVLDAATRASIADAFKATVIDRYGAQEIGIIATECPHGRHHVQSEMLMLEILAPDGSPAPPGTLGEVVVTGFYNYAMPLIRYSLGDYAALSDAPCACGRRLPVLGRIAGRSRDIFRLEDGRGIWPYVPFAELRDFIEAKQFQIIQTGFRQIEVHFVPEGAGHVAREDAIAFVRRCLDFEAEVDLIAVDDIPRTSSGKYFDYVSRLNP